MAQLSADRVRKVKWLEYIRRTTNECRHNMPPPPASRRSDSLRLLATIIQIQIQTFDLLTLKVVYESRVTWATSVPILVFLGLSVLDLGPMYATDRRQTRIIA